MDSDISISQSELHTLLETIDEKFSTNSINYSNTIEKIEQNIKDTRDTLMQQFKSTINTNHMEEPNDDDFTFSGFSN